MNYPNKQELEQLSKATALQVKIALDNAVSMHVFLQSLTVDDLTGVSEKGQALGYNFSAADANAMKATYGALDKLQKIATAQDTIAVADDHFFNAKKIWGVPFIQRA